MKKITVFALNTNGAVIGSNWTYNKSEVKGLVLYFKKFTSASGVKVGNKVWMF